MGQRESFLAPTRGGQLGGWIEGEGEPLLLLHGGPGLSYEILDEVAADVGAGYLDQGTEEVAAELAKGAVDTRVHALARGSRLRSRCTIALRAG